MYRCVRVVLLPSHIDAEAPEGGCTVVRPVLLSSDPGHGSRILRAIGDGVAMVRRMYSQYILTSRVSAGGKRYRVCPLYASVDLCNNVLATCQRINITPKRLTRASTPSAPPIRMHGGQTHSPARGRLRCLNKGQDYLGFGHHGAFDGLSDKFCWGTGLKRDHTRRGIEQ